MIYKTTSPKLYNYEREDLLSLSEIESCAFPKVKQKC